MLPFVSACDYYDVSDLGCGEVDESTGRWFKACLGRAHDSVSSSTFLLILLLPISLGCEKIKWSKISGSDVKTTMHLKCLNCLRANISTMPGS